MIEIKELEKYYLRGAEKVHALKGISLYIPRGDFISITGPSGTGKTTLLQIIGCLDRPSRGSVSLNGIKIENMTEKELLQIRRQKIGFVFQNFYLINGLSVLDNVLLPTIFARKEKKRKDVLPLLQKVGLLERADHKPNQLSGGEMQRVAIARALINEPEILLADEPTGNLDLDNSERIFELFRFLNSQGLTTIVVTHNPELASKTKRVIKLKDGKVEH
ncbi:MAG: ABC transporter ATP-binding protein [Thermodesulfovibrionales bacterium]|nr:ABC transporter ATP-binding protein [Thermodesulfovibrionales bacterium]